MNITEKTECRERAARALENVPVNDILARGEAFLERLLQDERYLNAKTIFCYLSVDKEPPTTPIITDALKRGKTVCAPVCISRGVMKARKFTGFDAIERDKYDIPVPQKGLPYIGEGKIDFSVVPCVACGEDLTRIGHGAGFYDRFLAKTNCFSAALCHEETLFKTVPSDEFDLKMDAVITQEKSIYSGEKQDA